MQVANDARSHKVLFRKSTVRNVCPLKTSCFCENDQREELISLIGLLLCAWNINVSDPPLGWFGTRFDSGEMLSRWTLNRACYFLLLVALYFENTTGRRCRLSNISIPVSVRTLLYVHRIGVLHKNANDGQHDNLLASCRPRNGFFQFMKDFFTQHMVTMVFLHIPKDDHDIVTEEDALSRANCIFTIAFRMREKTKKHTR